MKLLSWVFGANRHKQILIVPVSAFSGASQFIVEPDLGAYFSQIPTNAGVDYPIRFSLISDLLNWRRPSDVSRFVVAVIVDTVKRMSWGRLGFHVGEECRKVIAPASEHGNSTTTVISETLNILVVAPVEHISPRSVFRGSPHSVSEMAIHQEASA